MTVPQTPRSTVPPQVWAELQRVVQRWSQLPLDQALVCAGRVRAFVQSLADEVAQATGTRRCGVPDCGPAALMDQLTVMVYDASAAEVTATRPSTLVQDLVRLRHELG